jgi:tryptophan synthase alpha chain
MTPASRPPTQNRIDRTFARLRASGQRAFMPFVAAGDPDLAATAAVLRACAAAGADLIELGVPYSDPVADGPAIQEAFTRALNAGVTVAKVFDMVRSLRSEVDTPICSMLSFSIVHRIGPRRYMEAAAQVGIDGAIIPDLPVEESAEVVEAAERCGIHVVFLAAPTTPESRLRLIVERGRGFIYCVSVAGVTGVRDILPADLVARVRRLKSLTDLPIAVGFGVSRPEHVRLVCSVADGAIVGSALVKAVYAAALAGQDPAKAAGELVRELSAPTRG